ncbi:hypothetical protein [Azospirillum brasilense]|uniref:hypothetical protein n=1 Tax=Azospirillum brasilense TaxID=192 RepID=UPI000E0A825F|nr:hypothetical protein [Azospirillum brasilense]
MPLLSDYISEANLPLQDGGTLLVRHADEDRVGDRVMFDAWRYSDPRFESYYRTQNPEAGPRYEAARYLLKFIKTPVACLTERVPGLPREEQNVTLFIGVWEVVGLPRPCGLGDRDELLDIDAHAAGYIRYDPAMLHPSEALADLIGRLVIDWPKNKRRAWRHWAHRQDKEVLTVLTEPQGPYAPRRRQ